MEQLDQIFRNRLAQAEVPPPPEVWHAVENDLKHQPLETNLRQRLDTAVVPPPAAVWAGIAKEIAPAPVDNMIRERLAQSAIFPPPEVWPAVEEQIRDRRRKPAVAWWIWSSALVAVLGAWWMFSADAAQENTSNAKVESADPAIAVSSSANIISLGQSEPAVSEGNAIVSAGLVPSASTNDVPYIIPGSSVAKSVSLSSGSFVPPTAAAVVSGREQMPGTASLPATPLIGKEAESAHISGFFASTMLLPVKPIALFPPTYPLISASRIKTRQIKLTRKKKEATDHCYDFESHKNAWLFDVYTGPVYAEKQFAAVAGEVNGQYLSKRQKTEGQGWGFNGGLRATFLFHEHFSLSVGAQYQQFSEVFQHQEQTSVDYVVIHRADGTQDTIDAIYGVNNTKVINRFRFLDIPVLLGYETRHGRMGLRVQAGVVANMIFNKRGAIIAPQTNKPGFFTPGSGTQEVFKTNTGLSAQGSIQWFYHLQPRVRVFAEPYYQRILQPVTLPSHLLEQRYNLIGVKMGVTKIF